MGRLNPVRKSFWQSFARAYRLGLGRAELAWAGLAWLGPGLGNTQDEAPEPPPQNGETQRHSGPKQTKNGAFPRPRMGRLNPVRMAELCQGLQAWAGPG